MQVALIFVDNMRIGGYQRLALDEAYALSDRGWETSLLTLEQTNNPNSVINLTDIEKDLLAKKGIQVKVLPESRIKLYFALRKLLKSVDFSALVISHSLRSSFVLKLVQFTVINSNYKINTKIHQIPQLSDARQKFKRFLYSQFTDKLYCFSEAVKSNWYSQFGPSFKWVVNLGKDINVLRNGVYVPRIPTLSRIQDEIRPRIIFLGRITFWKGLEVVADLAKVQSLSSFDFVLIVPQWTEDEVEGLRMILGNRLKIISGKSINEIKFFQGDIHIYPTQYPFDSSFAESISLNCLELAVVGIPSLVTKGGQQTWTESIFMNYFIEVDWGDVSDVTKKIQSMSLKPINADIQLQLLKLVDVNNEIDRLIES